MKKSLNGLLIFSFLVLLWGCDKEDEEGRVKLKFPVLNITGADMLAVFEDDNSGGRVASGHDGNLYKLMADGTFEEVKYVNPDGTDVDPGVANMLIYVREVRKFNDNIVLLEGDFSLYDTLGNAITYRQILVRKSDGAIFDFSDFHFSGGLENHRIETDNSGLFYFEATTISQGGMALFRLDISNIENPSYINILPTGQHISPGPGSSGMGLGFVVDNAGNAYYRSSLPGLKIIKKTGGLISSEDHIQYFWKGINGHIYSILEDGHIYKLQVVGDELVKNKVWNNDDGTVYHAEGTAYRINKGNSVLFIDGYESWEFNESENKVTKVDGPLNEWLEKVFYPGEDHVYIYKASKLYKMNIWDYSHEEISNGDFEFYTFGANSNNELVFSALRFSDAKKVTGKITASDQVIILEAESNKTASSLVRLN